jgi:hypothetical protein
VKACEENSSFSLVRGMPPASTVLAPTKKCNNADYSRAITLNYTDKYLRIKEYNTPKFLRTLIRVFRDECLQAPNEEDTERLMSMNEAMGGQPCLGSMD